MANSLFPISMNQLQPRYMSHYIAGDRAENIRRLMLLSVGVMLTALLLFNLLRSEGEDTSFNEPYISSSEFTKDSDRVASVPIVPMQSTPLQLVQTQEDHTQVNSSTAASALVNANPIVLASTVPQTNTTPTLAKLTPQVPAASKEISIRRRDNMMKILTTNGLSAKEARQIQLLPLAFGPLMHLREGHKLVLNFNGAHALQKLSYAIDKDTQLVITRKNDSYEPRILGNDFETRLKTTSVTLTSASLSKANLPAKLSHDLADIFEGQEINKGARLTVLHELLYKNGKAQKIGHVIAAQITHANDTVAMIGKVDANGQITNYYNPNGRSLKAGFLRSPVHYSHVSSPFNLHRKHPILHTVRPHFGVDLAAHSGSPIVATGDGKVGFAGHKGGYGNAIFIRHNAKYSTVYGHMARFAKGIHAGSHVTAGQVIGYVGMSGLATGPHIHFEFRVNGVPHDPMHIKLPGGSSLSGSILRGFKPYAQAVEKLLISA